MMRGCSVSGCERTYLASGLCSLHYQRVKRTRTTADPTWRRANGSGSVTKLGYIVLGTEGAHTFEHVRVAEKALGKPLPTGAVVHHVNENPADNSSSNLVICPSAGYHMLLHQRMRAFAACGHYDWLKCAICKTYDSPSNLTKYKNGNIHHRDCWNLNQRAYRAASKPCR